MIRLSFKSMKRKFLITILILAFFLGISGSILGVLPAQADCKLNDKGQEICSLENPLQGEQTEATAIIGTVIKAALGIIGALTLLMLVWGGFQWLISAGNPEKVKMGTQTMVWAIIGVFLVFASYLLLSTFTDYLTGKT